MAQKQGSSTTQGGRLDGSVGAAVAAGDFALGAGWGNSASVSAVASGSNDQRGIITITSAGTGQAQATATVLLTFKDGAYAGTPFAKVQLIDNSNAITEAQPQGQTISTTQLGWTHSVLPVASKTYKFFYEVIA
jgi:hypothetical protein